MAVHDRTAADTTSSRWRVSPQHLPLTNHDHHHSTPFPAPLPPCLLPCLSACRSTFTCCTHQDSPATCLAGKYNDSSSAYGYYNSYPDSSFRSDSILDTYISPQTAATCAWSYESTLCPPHMMHTCLGSGTLNW